MESKTSQQAQIVPSGQFLNLWLARWLVSAAENPNSAKATIVERGNGGLVIELQDQDGLASGGVVLTNTIGHIHVLPRIDPSDDTKHVPLTLQTLLEAQRNELKKKAHKDKVYRYGEVCLYGFIPLVIIGILAWLLRLLF